MVTRPRLRSILTGLALYAMAALMIGYFGSNAFSGNHGLKARQELDLQIADLTRELGTVRAEREQWTKKVVLLRSDGIDPDLLDERARTLLDYADPRDAVLVLQNP